MQALKKTWFISDLHLDVNHPEITEHFRDVLKSATGNVEAIYILGDLFELWIGDDDDTPLHSAIIAAIRGTVDAGTRVYFICGNRDFLIGKRFMAASGAVLLQDPTKINLYATPVLLMHGDLLCTQDTAYLRARKFAHNKLVQTLFLLLPLKLRRKIAARARAASEKHTSTTQLSIMDVTQSEVENIMQQHNVHTLIHGHTHRQNIHRFTLSSKEVTRIVLPAWHHGGTVFEWCEDGATAYIRCEDLL